MTHDEPQTVAEVGHLRWLLLQASAATDDITHPDSPGHVVIDALFLALLIWIATRFQLSGFLPGRLLAALFIAVIGVSFLGGLYHYAIARPLARRART